MPQNQPFEMPKQLRELAEKNVEQARAAYAPFMDAMTQAMSAWSTAPSSVMTDREQSYELIKVAVPVSDYEQTCTTTTILPNCFAWT